MPKHTSSYSLQDLAKQVTGSVFCVAITLAPPPRQTGWRKPVSAKSRCCLQHVQSLLGAHVIFCATSPSMGELALARTHYVGYSLQPNYADTIRQARHRNDRTLPMINTHLYQHLLMPDASSQALSICICDLWVRALLCSSTLASRWAHVLARVSQDERWICWLDITACPTKNCSLYPLGCLLTAKLLAHKVSALVAHRWHNSSPAWRMLRWSQCW